jgi:hypothetical protein
VDWSDELEDQRQGVRRLEQGWRWAQDVHESEIAIELSAFIERHGTANVRLGAGIHEDHAVYVNDFDDLLNELKEDLLNVEMGHTMPPREDD